MHLLRVSIRKFGYCVQKFLPPSLFVLLPVYIYSLVCGLKQLWWWVGLVRHPVDQVLLCHLR